ncbi:MAG: putative universal stress protein [Nitrospira sp. OLB3]|nr:MAG: putative universal stress protein [Nitrospira sp. OLB3]
MSWWCRRENTRAHDTHPPPGRRFFETCLPSRPLRHQAGVGLEPEPHRRPCPPSAARFHVLDTRHPPFARSPQDQGHARIGPRDSFRERQSGAGQIQTARRGTGRCHPADCDEIRAGLIVMGTHGRSGLDRLKLGSVADAVLRRAHCPVFTIRAAAGGHPAVHPLRLNLGRILVATDFSPSSEAALRHATELARLLPAEVLLLHVAADSTETRIEEKFRRALSASRSGDVVGGQLLLQGDPAESILAHATRTKTRLIVMGTQGRRGMERLLLGSVAEAVIRGAHCPVLVVRNGGRHRRPAPPAPTAHRH